MTNSIIQQLERDANKKNAFQAKIAYAQYYVDNGHLIDAKGILYAVLTYKSTVPLEYRAMAHLLLAQCVEGQDVINAYEEVVKLLYPEEKNQFSHILFSALIALANLYKNSNVVQSETYQSMANSLEKKLPSIQITSEITPEFRYKMLRSHFQKKDLALADYEKGLLALLTDPELTDTLKAKILYQNIAISLIRAKETGDHEHLAVAQRFCEQLRKDSKLKVLSKASDKAFVIERSIKEHLREIGKVTYRQATISEETKTFAIDLLNGTYFKKKDENYGNIQDLDSKRAMGISFWGNAEQSKKPGAQAYSRALSATKSMKLTARESNGREHCVELPLQARISDFKKFIDTAASASMTQEKSFRYESAVLDQNANHKLVEYGIHEGSTILISNRR